jgi:hypothetical protein
MRNAKQIAASIAKVSTKGVKWSAEVQGLLVEVAGHMVCNNEASLGLKMLNSFEGTKHKENIARWLAEHTVFSMVGGKAVIVKSRHEKLTHGFASNINGQHIAAAEAHMLELAKVKAWDYAEKKESADRVAEVFDALKTVEELIDSLSKKCQEQGKASERANKGLTANKKAMSYEHLDIERYLREAVEKYHADRAAFEPAKKEA